MKTSTSKTGDIPTSSPRPILRLSTSLSLDPRPVRKHGTRRRQNEIYWPALVMLLAAILVLGSARGLGVAYAADGDLDLSFDGDGKVTTSFPGAAVINAVAIQSDGKIVAVGSTTVNGANDFALARYNPNGSLDTSFGGDGIVTTFNDYIPQVAYAVAIQSDGKIVVAGYQHYMNDDFALARYNSDGSLDADFGVGGIVITDVDYSNERAYAVAIQPDGKIIAAGYTAIIDSDDFVLIRYNQNGLRDSTFGDYGQGIKVDDFGNPGIYDFREDFIQAMAIQSDGKIVAAGYTYVYGSPDYNFALARYNSNGARDTSFSSDGHVTDGFYVGSEDRAYALTMQPAGKIVVAGYADDSYVRNFALARFDSAGSLDTSFGLFGHVTTDIAGGADEIRALALQTDGKIVAAGHANIPENPDTFALARYSADGVLDTTFSGDGKLTTDIGSTSDALGVVTQGDGKIVAAGSCLFDSYNNFALTRYQSTGAPTPTATSIPTDTPIPGVTSTPTITPIPTVPGGCNIEFTDVTPGSTFYDFVRCMACQDIINGYTSGCQSGNPCFRPNNNVTRGQLSKIVANAAGFTEPTGAQQFADVAPGSTFFDFIWRLSSRGFVNGYACGGPAEPCGPGNLPYFRPNNNAIRGQIAKIVANAAGLNDPAGDQIFEDVSPGSTFYDFVQRLANQEVMSGYQCGGAGEPCVDPDDLPYFRPANNATRGQTSKIVANTFFPDCNTPQRR